jgi:hypothetical protein
MAKKIFKWKFDAWHTAKSLMVLMIILAVLTYKPIFKGFIVHGYIVHVLDFIVVVLCGMECSICFTIVYSVKRKNEKTNG